MIGACVIVSPQPAEAQETNPKWSKQQRIYDHYFDSYAPILIADQNKTVHAFHYTDLIDDSSTDEGAISAIYYRQWRADTGWSLPVDIILPSADDLELILHGVTLDNKGYFHLIYSSGSMWNSNIYYSSAYARDADRASAWSKPIIIGEKTGQVSRAALAGDGNNNLVVVYSAQIEGPGLYSIYSSDSGNSWSDPEIVQVEYRQGFTPLFISMIDDGQGNTHAVWSVYNSDIIRAEEVYYARMNNHDKSWSDPVLLAKRDDQDYEADYPSIVSYNNELIVMYMDGSPPTRWMRRSADGGQTWTDPVRPFQLIGENGAIAFVIDSNNVLHALMGNRTPENIHGMWHSVWQGDRWGPIEAIVSGPQTPYFDPTEPRAIISQGNVLLAVWSKDTTEGPRNGAWFSYTTLNSPETPIVPIPDQDEVKQEPSLTPSTEPDTIASDPSVEHLQIDNPQQEVSTTLPQPDTQVNPMLSIFYSLGLVFVLVVVVFVLKNFLASLN
ncbi:MAG: exo-alpha-sialidase [Anaerolineales bacterium]